MDSTPPPDQATTLSPKTAPSLLPVRNVPPQDNANLSGQDDDEGRRPQGMDYLDFDLEIGPGRGREYPVAAVGPEVGEARDVMRFPFDELALNNQLLALENALLRSGGTRRRILSPLERTVQTFGQALFNALFTGEVGARYVQSQREAERQGKGLRLKLRMEPPELAALPWEFLYDPSRGEYVCFSRNTPIVRYLDLPQYRPPLVVTPPLRILGMIPRPSELADLDVEREWQRIDTAIDPLRAHSMIQLTWRAGQTWYDLQKAMRSGPWHIFHFIGHGDFDPNTDEGRIVLEDEDGRAHYLSATQLGRLLSDHRPLRLVMLNACEGARGSKQDIFSSSAATLVRGQGSDAATFMAGYRMGYLSKSADACSQQSRRDSTEWGRTAAATTQSRLSIRN